MITLYEHLRELRQSLKDDGEAELKIPVTSLVLGRGWCDGVCDLDDYEEYDCDYDGFYPIQITFEIGSEDTFTQDGRLRCFDLWPQIAVGHYDTQEETLAAIKEQNFTLLPQEPAE